MTPIATLSSSLRALFATVRDNPLIGKDAGLVMRKATFASAVLAFGIVLAGAFALSVVGYDGPTTKFEHYALPSLYGRAGMGTLVVLFAVVTGVLFPILASSAIAGEKERGTYTLLVTSALTPGQIVMGKFIALLLTVAPVLFLITPMFALSAFGGEVTVLSIAGFLGYLTVGVMLQMAVGLWTSTLVDRVRFAGPLSMAVSAMVVWPVFCFPLFGAVAAWNESAGIGVMGPAIVVVLFGALGVVAVSLYAATMRLSPASLPREPARKVIVTVLEFASPIVGALTLGMVHFTHPSEAFDFGGVYGHVLPLVVGLLLFLLVIFDVSYAAHTGSELSDARSFRRAIVATGARIGLGMLIAAPIAAAFGANFESKRVTVTLADCLVGAGFLTLGYVGLASLVSFVARVLSMPALRMIVTAVVAGGVLIAPFFGAILAEAAHAGDWFPLLWMNPLTMITGSTALDFWDMSEGRILFFGMNPAIPGVLVFTCATAVALLTGAQRPYRPLAYRPAEAKKM